MSMLETSVLWPMLPVFLDYSLLITLCVLSNVYLLQSIQCVVANVTSVPRLLILINLCVLATQVAMATTH
jgi:hypothetical protein